MTETAQKRELHCHLCGKDAREVRKLTCERPGFICDGCILRGVESITDFDDERAPVNQWHGWRLKPRELLALARERGKDLGQELRLERAEDLSELPAGSLLRLICFAALYADELRHPEEVRQIAREWNYRSPAKALA